MHPLHPLLPDLPAQLVPRQGERWSALGTYLAALPESPADIYTLCTMLLHDLHALQEHLAQNAKR